MLQLDWNHKSVILSSGNLYKEALILLTYGTPT